MATPQPRFTATSKDGVPISVFKVGSGPAMVMVHGSASVGLSWASVLPELSRKFALYVMDRRGRGQSGDAPDYSVQAEIDDIEAVIEAVGEPATLLAHSYGALLAVAAAANGARLKSVSRMILYEPPVYDVPGPEHSAMHRKMSQAAQSGDNEAVASEFIAGVMGEQAMKIIRASPGWPLIAAMSGTLLREVQTVSDYRISTTALNSWKVPTTMLLGDQSPDYMKAAARHICKSMANCQLVMLKGQGHVAAQQAPSLFVTTVLDAAAQ
jgi:pimeloyl-ACP methyl ester carboxylesterase